MKEQDKIKMNLNIGGQLLTLTVPFSKQDFTRDVERDLDRLYTEWKRRFPSKSDKEVLAMVAFQYASFYGELLERYNTAAKRADECLGLLEEPDESPEQSVQLDFDI